MGKFLSPIMTDWSSLRTLLSYSDFIIGVANISNSNKPIGKSNKSTSDTEIKEWVAPRSIRTWSD